MAVPRESRITGLLLSCLALLSFQAGCNSAPLGYRRNLGEQSVFDVKQYGAVGDGKSDDTMKFIKAWNAACQAKGPARLVVPAGKFLTGELVFQGPCSAKPITVEIQGTLLSNTDLSVYTRGLWISVESVDGVIITGCGTLNGQGEVTYKYGGKGAETLLPISLQFLKVNNSVIRDIKSLNSKGFHMKVTYSNNITVTNVNVTAPGDSPNTDGLHISSSDQVTVSNSIIATGDDCVSVGEGNSDIIITNITCGPGHGISVGSLGKRTSETDVKGIKVTNCTLIGTTNGARIKTYRNSPELQASSIIYENIIMDNVKNPIIIDQYYNSKDKAEPSKVKISDVHFRNIRGTSVSPVAVSLNCSDAVPCKDVELANINLRPAQGIAALSSKCAHVKPTILGLHPAGCT